jgi:hypothetical protein
MFRLCSTVSRRSWACLVALYHAASAATLTSSDRGLPEGVEEVSSAHPRCKQALVPEFLPGAVALTEIYSTPAGCTVREETYARSLLLPRGGGGGA